MSGRVDRATEGASELRRLLTAAVLVGVASWAGLAMIRPGGLSPFWPANGVLLAFLMTSPRRRWPVYLLAGIAVNLLTHVCQHYVLWPSIGTSLANTLEIFIAAWPFHNSAPKRPDLTRRSCLVRFAVFGGVLGPLASGLWVVCTTTHFLNYYSLAVRFRLWFLADALGIILITPLMLALLEPELMKLFVGKRLVETLGLLSLLMATAIFVFRHEDFPFPFLVLVVLIPVIFRLGLAGSAIGVLLVSFPATHYTFEGHGPLARVGVLYWSLFLQIYFVILLAVVYLLAAVLALEKRLADDLRRSETRYRVLAETSQDIIFQTTLEGVRTYVSPSIRMVTGWGEEELPPPDNFAVLVHPADRGKFEELFKKLRTEPGSHTLVYRGRRRDGQYGWLEAYVATIFNETSVPDELVWTVRDISLRVAHEERLRSEKRQAQELAWTDGLTGLNNRRAFDERLAEEWDFAEKTGSPLSLLLLDVDHFKSYNDTYGHQAGDECLRQIARVLPECIRESGDVAARYGGEEFAVVLRHADPKRAQEVAERIREKVRELQVDHARSATGKVTLSIGVASTGLSRHSDTVSLIAAADNALYAAKRSGRDRLSLAS